ncbi:DUF6879 family protein [Streptomyces sp. CB02261]|uniref:DUF6879 family protein n=1 Tax=Streptomyces sp. CB02261 TaxID=1703940 RepID=UPI00308309F7
MRGVYVVGEEREVYGTFLCDGSVPADDSEFWSGRLPLVERTVARGVKVHRARIVSEPVTGYIRFEHAITGPQPGVGGGGAVCGHVSKAFERLSGRRAAPRDSSVPGRPRRVRDRKASGPVTHVCQEHTSDEESVLSTAGPDRPTPADGHGACGDGPPPRRHRLRKRRGTGRRGRSPGTSGDRRRHHRHWAEPAARRGTGAPAPVHDDGRVPVLGQAREPTARGA